jgi:hypothetical protein
MTFALTQQELTLLTGALGYDPNPHEQRCYYKLKQYLNREPSDSELQNMKTDANLALWVLVDPNLQ